MNLKNTIQDFLFNQYKNLETKDHALQYLFIEITRRCNLNCLHCGSDCKSEPATAELTTDSWLKIIKYINEHFGKNVNFIITGGEPLMHPDLEKIGNTISQHGMRWGMVTNGLALTKQKFSQLQSAGLYSITISMDGLEPEHNFIRNNHFAFAKATEAIQMVFESQLKQKDVVTCVYPGNVNKLEQIAELLIELNVTKWRLFRIFPSGRAANNDTLLLNFEQSQFLVLWILKNKPKYSERGLNLQFSCEGYFPFEINKQIHNHPSFCRAGINIASILCDGSITGCSNNHSSFTAGNILTDDFATVWNNKFKRFRKREWINNTLCAECNHLKECKGASIHLWELGKKQPEFCYQQNKTNV